MSLINVSHFSAVSDGLETSFAGLKKKKKKPVGGNVDNFVVFGELLVALIAYGMYCDV